MFSLWRIFAALTCVTVLSVNIHGMPKFGEYRGIHQEKLDEDKRIVLVDKGKAMAEIVSASGNSGVCGFAAEELRDIIAAATGVKLDIVKTRSAGKNALILGDSREARELGIDLKSIPRDGFIIRSSGTDTIVIVGNDCDKTDIRKSLSKGIWAQFYERGTLFGVYHFLERFLETRFYFPGEYGTLIPKRDSLAVPGIDIVEAPDFSRRRVSAYSGEMPGGLGGKEKSEYCNTNMLRLRAETSYIPNMHSLSRLGLAERFAQSNPEYFALLGNGRRDNDLSLPGHRGHLCYSNSGLRNEIYEDAKAYLTGKPATARNVSTKGRPVWDNSAFQPGYFNIMPQDGHAPSSYCRCPECSKYYENGQAGELVWEFVADIAGRLKKDGIPGYVTAMAYGPSKLVPKVSLPDNVIVMVAAVGPWMEGVPAARDEMDGIIRSWVDKVAPHRIWMWNYADKHGSRNIPGIPPVTPVSVGSFYSRHAPHICGAFLQTDTDRYMFNYLDWYVFFKLAWNNKTDVGKLLDEHYELMFGKGAPAMKEFFTELEQLWCLKMVGNTMDSPIGPKSIVPSETTIWEEIYSAGQIDKFRAMFDKADKLVSGDDGSQARIKFMREQVLQPLEEVRKAYLERKSEIDDLVYSVGKRPEDSEELVLVPFKADKALVKTTVRAHWDEKYLYIKFDCQEPRMDKLSASVRKKDDPYIWQDSSVELFLDPSCTRREAYQIIVNASGSVSDQRMTIGENGEKLMDWSWDSGIAAKVSRDKQSWQADLRIPLKNLGIPADVKKTSIVANFNRSRNLKESDRDENQFYSWSPYLTGGFHELERFGLLILESNSSPSASLIKNGDWRKLKKDGMPLDWHVSRNAEERQHTQIDLEVHRNAGHSLRLEGMGDDKEVMVSQFLPGLKPNTKYHLTFFVKTDNVEACGRDGGAVVNIFTTRNEWFPRNRYSGTTPWTKQGFYFTTEADVNKEKKSYIRLRLKNSKGTVWFDDIKLREVKA